MCFSAWVEMRHNGSSRANERARYIKSGLGWVAGISPRVGKHSADADYHHEASRRTGHVPKAQTCAFVGERILTIYAHTGPLPR